MLPSIKSIIANDDYILRVKFDDEKTVDYDLKDDMRTLPRYGDLENGLYRYVMLDENRTCVYWNDSIDLPSDILYEYGKTLTV